MIQFTKMPTGAPLFLAYNIGDEASLEPALEKELIAQGFAVPVQEDKKAGKSDEKPVGETKPKGGKTSTKPAGKTEEKGANPPEKPADETPEGNAKPNA